MLNTLLPRPDARVSDTSAGAEKPTARAVSGLRTVRTPSDHDSEPKR